LLHLSELKEVGKLFAESQNVHVLLIHTVYVTVSDIDINMQVDRKLCIA